MQRARLSYSLILLTAALPWALACRTPTRVDSVAARVVPRLERVPLWIGEHEFHRRRLANGLEALAVHSAVEGTAGRASIFCVYGVGKRMEGPLTTGLAHLVEHAMYTGTSEVGPDQHSAIVQDLGGNSNAYTREDFTLYYDHDVPSSTLEVVLELEADRMRGLRFTEEAFLHERRRLELEEAETFTSRMRRAELLESALYRTHPYGAGAFDEEGHTRARALSVQVARAFYDTWYHPDHAAIVVVSDREPGDVLDAIERIFERIPCGPPAPPLPLEEPAAGGMASFESNLSTVSTALCWIGPALREEGGGLRDRCALQVLERILTRVARDSGETAEVTMGGRVDRDLFSLEATGEDASERMWRLLRGVVEDTADTNVFREEKERLAGELDDRPLLGRPYFALAGVLGVHAALGEPDLVFERRRVLAHLTPDDMRRAAERWLDEKRCFVVHFLPGGEAQEALPDDPRALSEIAETAVSSGDMARAIRAYEKLAEGTTDRKYKVIYLYSLADARIKAGDLAGARADLLAALAIVEYPAVRELLEDVERRLSATPSSTSAPAQADPAVQAADHADVGPNTHDENIVPSGRRARVIGEEQPALTESALELMAQIERWRELPFRTDLDVEVVAQDDVDVDIDGDREKLKGWYEPDTKRLVVVAAGTDTFARGTMLHEMFHALQDQHFDLEHLHAGAASSDGDLARSALIEGEAMLCVSEVMDYDFESHLGTPPAGDLDPERFGKMFRYGAGLRFVRALRDDGGWERVTEAYADPPRTTAEIYHPQRYLDGTESARIDVERWVASDTGSVEPFGEYDLRLLLSGPVSTRPAAERLGSALEDGMQVTPTGEGSGRTLMLLFAESSTARELVELSTELGGTGRLLGEGGRLVRLELVAD